MVEIRGLQYKSEENRVVLMFDTMRGNFHLACDNGKISEMRGEPSIHFFTEGEQSEMKNLTRVAYKLLHPKDELKA
jgi:hypothetical protein